jgi:fructose-bisphosphate aldolase class 1
MNQSIYTSFDQISKNIKDAAEVVAFYQNQIEPLEFFAKKRSGFRWELNRAFTENEVKSFFEILIRVADMAQKNGLVEIEADAFTF